MWSTHINILQYQFQIQLLGKCVNGFKKVERAGLSISFDQQNNNLTFIFLIT